MEELAHMQTIELAPGEWTRIHGRYLQPRRQEIIRLALCDLDNGEQVAPPVGTDAYFLTPGYEAQPIDLTDYFGFADGMPAVAVYAMPNDDEAVTVIATKF